MRRFFLIMLAILCVLLLCGDGALAQTQRYAPQNPPAGEGAAVPAYRVPQQPAGSPSAPGAYQQYQDNDADYKAGGGPASSWDESDEGVADLYYNSY